ncbi:MAG: hypothetical protein HRU13_13555, partial [Phycisphaerales bacterium]|nr:hypothetical protein [Phycisphaerales bacterium]
MTATQAQTRCTVTESQWSTLRQHVEFDLSTSTPVVGNVTDARSEGEWRVIRNGTEIRRVNRHLRFQWIGRHGDRVQYRYKDSAGNRGQWCGYVFDVGECDRRYEVNSATGLSSGPIYDTVANAMTQAMADTQDGESAEIVLADDQTHAMGTASA